MFPPASWFDEGIALHIAHWAIAREEERMYTKIKVRNNLVLIIVGKIMLLQNNLIKN
jgi:hypothetical protein